MGEQRKWFFEMDSTGEDAVTIEDVYEPFLIQLGFIARTPRGRIALKGAYDHLGLPLSKAQINALSVYEISGDIDDGTN